MKNPISRQIKTDAIRRANLARTQDEDDRARITRAFARGRAATETAQRIPLPPAITAEIVREATRELAKIMARQLYEQKGPELTHYAVKVAEYVMSWERGARDEEVRVFVERDIKTRAFRLRFRSPSLQFSTTVSEDVMQLENRGNRHFDPYAFVPQPAEFRR